MAGELNGTKVLLQKGSSPANIVGQMEITSSWGGSPIDISNKSNGDNVTYLDGEVSSQQLTISGTIVYNSDALYKEMVTEQITCKQDDYTLLYPDGRAYAGKFTPSGFSDAIPHGDKVSTTFTLASSGEPATTEPS